MKKDHKIGIFLALWVSCCISVNAQETNSVQDDSLSMEKILHDLPEVMIKGERPIAKVTRGQITYNMPLLMEKMPADNAYDALTRIPSVAENNGSLNYAGRPVSLIINGKVTTLTAEQVAERLKAIPAEQLSKAEVMMSAPARYHVRGTVINIVTKDYTGTHQVSGQLSGSYGQGKYGTGSGIGNIIYNSGKLTVDALYSYRKGKEYAKDQHIAVHPLNGERIPYEDETKNKSSEIVHNYHLGLDYAFGENHTFSVLYTGSWSSVHSKNSTIGTLFDEESGSSVAGNCNSQQYTKSHDYLHNVDVSYSLPIGLKLAASYTNFNTPHTQFLDGFMGDTERNLVADSRQKISEWLFAADQSHELKNGWGISYGAKFQSTNNNSYQTTSTPDGEVLEDATSSVDYNERIINGYGGFSKQFNKKLSMELSLTAENFHSPVWNEWKVYPTFNGMWNADDNNMLNLSFSSNSEYPSYWSTMSNIHYTSTYSEIWGSPDLKPYSSYELSMMWQHKRRYTFVAFANFKPDYFVQMAYQTSDRMAVIMKETNFDFSNQFGLQASAQFSAGSWLNGNISATALYKHEKSNNFFDLPFDRKKFIGIVSGNVSALLEKKHKIRFMLQSFVQTPAIQGVYDIKTVFRMYASLHWSSVNNKWNVVLSGDNIFNGNFDIHSTSGNQDFTMRIWQNYTSGSVKVIYKIGNFKEKKTKTVDTSRMGH